MTMRHADIQKQFEVISGTQYLRCLRCGDAKIKNQGLATLAHLAKCKGEPTKE